MKILIISPTQTGIGGIAQHVQGLSKFLIDNGHHVEIISSENTFTIPIKGLKNLSFMVSSFLKSKLKKNFDIVHAHNIPSALAMRNSSGKKILTIHGVFSRQVEQLHGHTTGKVSDSFELNALSWADAITTISKEAYDYYTRLDFTVKQIPNGISTSDIPSTGKKLYNNQVIFAGRLSKEKGTQTLADICKKLSAKINLVIVGDGPEENRIKNIADTKTNVHYLGRLNHEKTMELVKGSNILLQPSLNEGISTTILEAMACKTCVIASNIGGNTELIENKKSGILIEPLDVDSFLEQIGDMVNNPSLREKLVDNAFERVKRFDWKEIGNEYLELYNFVLNQD